MVQGQIKTQLIHTIQILNYVPKQSQDLLTNTFSKSQHILITSTLLLLLLLNDRNDQVLWLKILLLLNITRGKAEGLNY